MTRFLLSIATLLYACMSSAETRVDLQTQGKGLLNDCVLIRKSATTLTTGSCAFSFPNQDKVSLSGLNITITSGSGTAFIYGDTDGAVHVGHSATMTILCNSCTDSGYMVSFPVDVARIATWPATEGVWDASGQTDDRAMLHGVLRLTPGPGLIISDSGIEKQISADTALLQTKLAAQAGTELLCSGSEAATAQTCAMSPTLTAYTSGMRIRWKSGATNSAGAITLNVDSLGAKAVKNPDGSTDPTVNELLRGQYYDLTYDGTVFRLATSGGALASWQEDVWFPVAGNGATGTPTVAVGGWTVINGSSPTIIVHGVAAVASMAFGDGGTTSAYLTWRVPPKWNGGLMAFSLMTASGVNASAGQTAAIRVATACSGVGDSYVEPSYNTPQNGYVISENQPAINSSLTMNLDMTGCSSGDRIMIQVQRLGTDALDTLVGSLVVLGANISYTRVL